MVAGLTRARGLIPLALLACAVVLTAAGLAFGWWLDNIHNGLLAVSFTFVGAYVLFQRPGHREGVLFMATGTVHAAMFLGRQVGHFLPDLSPWWGWLGAWPLAPALFLTTLSVICFPDGRLPSRYWRPLVALLVVDTAFLAVLSAIWPVGYQMAGLALAHPFTAEAPGPAQLLWNAIAYPSFVLFQLLWVVSLVERWIRRPGIVRRQVVWLAAAAGVSVVLLLIGLAVWGSPRAGVLAAALLPVAAGWAIVHGQHVAAYSALSWLSRGAPDPDALPTQMARAIGDAIETRRVTIWLGDANRLHLVGDWPGDGTTEHASTLAELNGQPGTISQPARRGDRIVGFIAIQRVDPLTRAEERLLADLGAQAALLLEHVTTAELIARRAGSAELDRLTAREKEVLALIAQGKSNAAICETLHLSVKTIEPVVGAIFAKLGLASDSGQNRRVLAAVEYLRSVG